MSMRNILRKLVSGHRIDSGEFSARDGMTPDEKELEHFKRKEYLEDVKKELKQYRDKERDSLWKGSSMNDEHQIIKAKNVFKNQKKIF